MFGGGFWGAGFVGSDDHLTQEREPPPRPTTLEFPKYSPPFAPRKLTRKTSSRLQYKICHSRGIADVEEDDLASLNIRYTHDATLDSFLPDKSFSSRPLLYDDDLQAMLDEICVDNEDAFREALRLDPLPGKQKPRLAYARNFFGSLEDMARYWDDQQDNYYSVPVGKAKSDVKSSGEGKGNASSRQDSSTTNVITSRDNDVRMGNSSEPSTDQDAEVDTKEVYRGYRISNGEAMNPGTRVAMTKNFLKLVLHKFNCRDHEPVPAPREKFAIRGIRLQSIQYHFCVARVPNDQKQARARMVEGPLMGVQIREELRFKVKEGLLTPEKASFVGERFDLLREIGCLLILAQQRAREGTDRKQRASQSDKWWVAKPRWGGGPTRWGQLAHEVYEEDDPSWGPEEKRLQEEKRQRTVGEEEAKDLDATLEAVNSKKVDVEDLLAKAEKAASPPDNPTTSPSHASPLPFLEARHRRKKLRSLERPPGDDPSSMRDGKRVMYTPPFRRKWYQEWQKLRPNTSTQDDRIIYRQIGKATDEVEDDINRAGFDEVYLVSSVNHHISLTKMRVHSAYLEWLDNGNEVAAGSEDMDTMHNVLYVSRSKWFDMFDVDARKELLVGLWSVMSWLNREIVPTQEVENMKSRKSEAAEPDTGQPKSA